MKIKLLGLVALLIILISSLEIVCANEFDELNDFNELNETEELDAVDPLKPVHLPGKSMDGEVEPLIEEPSTPVDPSKPIHLPGKRKYEQVEPSIEEPSTPIDPSKPVHLPGKSKDGEVKHPIEKPCTPVDQADEDSKAAALLKNGQVIDIDTSAELSNLLKAATKTSRLAILHFSATWCGPCCMMSPFYTSLAGKYPKVVFLKVDIDEAIDVTREWSINSVPSFIFVKNGKEVDKVAGTDKNSLETKIAQHGN